jgi:lipid-A-disaccharide synthase
MTSSPEPVPGIMLAAGEASGDLHGAALCRELKRLVPGWRLFGMGGIHMAEAGMQLLADVTSHAVVGGSEAIGQVPRLLRAYRTLSAALATAPMPRALVLIDFPEFNLRLARAARRAGVPVVYFIPPQLWAWRRRRLRTIARLVTRVLAVFPFEVALYREEGIPVDFVGHPLLDTLVGTPTRLAARATLGVADDEVMVGLLPGSRPREVERLLPAMREAARLVGQARRVRWVLGLAPTIDRDRVGTVLSGGPAVTVVDRGAHTVMAAADLLLVASGTATLEAALIGTPMVICYQVSHVSFRLFLLLVRIPWIGLPNIALGRTVVPELYQQSMSATRLGQEALRLLGDPSALASQRAAFAELRGLLGQPGAARRAAHAVLEVAGAPA